MSSTTPLRLATGPLDVAPSPFTKTRRSAPKFQTCPKCSRTDVASGPSQLLRHCGSKEDHFELMMELKSLVDKKRSMRTGNSGQGDAKRTEVLEPATTSQVTDTTTTVSTQLKPQDDKECITTPLGDTPLHDAADITRRLTTAFPGSHIVVCMLNR